MQLLQNSVRSAAVLSCSMICWNRHPYWLLTLHIALLCIRMIQVLRKSVAISCASSLQNEGLLLYICGCPFSQYVKLNRCSLHMWLAANRTQLNFAKRWTVNNLPQKSWNCLSQKIGANKTLYVCSVFRRYGEYLLKERWYRQSTGLWKVWGLLHHLKISWTFVHRRLKIGPSFLPSLCKFLV